ncbi:hypothetical protein K505DRAFT_318668 [Melanomma pulvis-pyrius CBS 109.77]|uniref:Cupin type-2 domain-containing protein n=1 Tax=Melanomma pulvis-pyrius CBS 109.77 TaxID=1314802 RepID=A0A6A6WQC0_9PLEO|nr:hypothetical protein K505DRAFT_318668 [Melanomma pulvis-pyrius CBS 109.77]
MASGFTSPNVVKVDGVWQIEGKPREDFQILSIHHPANLPGKTILISLITMPPHGGTPSHRHGGATAIAIPISGATVNQMNGNPPQTYGPGDFWYEAPGCHHQRSENVEGGGEAKFFAVLIVDDETVEGGNWGNVLVLDKEVEAGEKVASK